MPTAQEQTNTGIPRRVIWLALAGAVGGFLFGFDSSVVNGAVDAMKEEFALSEAVTGFAVAIEHGGYVARMLAGIMVPVLSLTSAAFFWLSAYAVLSLLSVALFAAMWGRSGTTRSGANSSSTQAASKGTATSSTVSRSRPTSARGRSSRPRGTRPRTCACGSPSGGC